jgi:murein DD-endopeptidase MepM/ murein hydrolase activator NlpD
MSLVLIFSSIGYAFAGSSDYKKSQEELKKIQQEISKLKKEKREKSSEHKEVVQRMDNIESNIQNLESEIGTLQSRIQGAETSVASSKTELALAEKKIVLKNQVLNARLRAMYKMGHVGYLDVLLGSTDFGDMMTRVDMLQKIYHQDTSLLKDMQKQRNQISEKKTSLEKYANELKNLRSNLGVKQSALDQDLNKLEVEKVELSKDLKALDQKENQLIEDSNKLAKMLAKLKTTRAYVGGRMAWPTPGNYKVTSPFGNRVHPVLGYKKMHTGVDIGAPRNSPVVAAQDGTVIMAEYYSSYGRTVMIDHGGGYVTLYAHNNSLLVSAGQKVKKGQQIAKVGTTGTSTGNHCHFEVRLNGTVTNPMPWITK